METYIRQLLDDIRAAHRPEDPDTALPATPWEEDEDRTMRKVEEMFAEVERYINEDPPHSLSYYCGLTAEQFPPVEQLSDEQAAAVAGSFLEMLRSWNIGTDIPRELPRRVAYTLLVSLLGEHFHMDRWGTNTWCFCECEPAVCPYGELCVCKDFEWVKELPDGDEPEEELCERERLRRRWDDDFGPGAGETDFPF